MPDLTAQREKGQVPKKFQLELIGTESEDRLDKKICPWDAIKMYEFDEGVEHSKYFYEPKTLDAAKGVYVTNAVEKKRLEEKQLKLFETDRGKESKTCRSGSGPTYLRSCAAFR